MTYVHGVDLGPRMVVKVFKLLVNRPDMAFVSDTITTGSVIRTMAYKAYVRNYCEESHSW